MPRPLQNLQRDNFAVAEREAIRQLGRAAGEVTGDARPQNHRRAVLGRVQWLYRVPVLRLAALLPGLDRGQPFDRASLVADDGVRREAVREDFGVRTSLRVKVGGQREGQVEVHWGSPSGATVACFNVLKIDTRRREKNSRGAHSLFRCRQQSMVRDTWRT